MRFKVEKTKMPMSQIKGLLTNKRGQGMLEYVLAITSISLLALANVKWFGTWIVSTIASARAVM